MEIWSAATCRRFVWGSSQCLGIVREEKVSTERGDLHNGSATPMRGKSSTCRHDLFL